MSAQNKDGAWYRMASLVSSLRFLRNVIFVGADNSLRDWALALGHYSSNLALLLYCLKTVIGKKSAGENY